MIISGIGNPSKSSKAASSDPFCMFGGMRIVSENIKTYQS